MTPSRKIAVLLALTAGLTARAGSDPPQPGLDMSRVRFPESRICRPSPEWWSVPVPASAVHRTCFDQWGLELVWAEETGPAVVSRVLRYFPAARAGIRPGDVLSSIDGLAAHGRSFTELMEQMAPVTFVRNVTTTKESVRLTFARDDQRLRATFPYQVTTFFAGP